MLSNREQVAISAFQINSVTFKDGTYSGPNFAGDPTHTWIQDAIRDKVLCVSIGSTEQEEVEWVVKYPNGDSYLACAGDYLVLLTNGSIHVIPAGFLEAVFFIPSEEQAAVGKALVDQATTNGNTHGT